MSDGSAFEQSRKEWTQAADPLADRCYRDHFGDDCEIFRVENLPNQAHDTDDGIEVMHALDYAGLDLLVDAGGRWVTVEQRCRRVQSGDWLSFRIENGHPEHDEKLVKWSAARDTRGFVPDVLAFGHYEATLEVFKWFCLLDAPLVIDAVRNGETEGIRGDNGDGTAAEYVRIPELRDLDAIIAEWDGVT